MRLIDADALEYQMLYKENWLKGTGSEAQAIWKKDIDLQSTIDAVPVVRCRDCRWWDKIGDSPIGYCHACKHKYWSNSWEISIRRIHKEDFYCADGERKDGADNG